MRHKTFFLALAALLALCPVQAQTSSPAGAEETAPKTGVRFVICSPAGTKLPNPLYYSAGKNSAGQSVYKSVFISGRTPSARIRPEGGKVVFYDEDPTPPTDKNGKPDKTAKPKDMPNSVLTVGVPGNAGAKSLCIVVPGSSPAKSKTLFINEADFPKKGVHIINLSPAPLQMATSKKGDFSDKKESKIGPYKAGEGVSRSNSWTFTDGDHGDQISFQLTYQKQKNGKPVQQNIRRSKFLVSKNQSQINIVVKDPATDTLKLMSVQMGD